MHIKKRGTKALLYRSKWVPKGAEGNSHGYSRQLYVASVPLQTTEIPSSVAERLTPAELNLVEQQVIQPAVQAAARARTEARLRALDPLWRLDEALRLVSEAATLSGQAAVPAARVRLVFAALTTVQVIGGASQPVQRDPMEAAVEALGNAAKAVGSGNYGTAPEEGVRKSPVYARWLEIAAHVDGSAPGGLLRQLQARAWVKAKAR